MPHAAQLKNWMKDGTNSRIAQFGKPNGFAYIHTGLNEWSVNGTTLAISKKGSGLAGVLNPCIEKVPPPSPSFPSACCWGSAHAHTVPARQLDPSRAGSMLLRAQIVASPEYMAVCSKYWGDDASTVCIGGADTLTKQFVDQMMHEKTEAKTCADGYCPCP